MKGLSQEQTMNKCKADEYSKSILDITISGGEYPLEDCECYPCCYLRNNLSREKWLRIVDLRNKIATENRTKGANNG